MKISVMHVQLVRWYRTPLQGILMELIACGHMNHRIIQYDTVSRMRSVWAARKACIPNHFGNSRFTVCNQANLSLSPDHCFGAVRNSIFSNRLQLLISIPPTFVMPKTTTGRNYSCSFEIHCDVLWWIVTQWLKHCKSIAVRHSLCV